MYSNKNPQDTEINYSPYMKLEQEIKSEPFFREPFPSINPEISKLIDKLKKIKRKK